MAEKKFVLFIVEGINDKKEIESILHTPYFAAFLSGFKPFFQVVNADVTADRNSSDKNIQEKVRKIVFDFRKKGIPYSNIKPSDIERIIHIVDTDGAFIPRNNIKASDVGRYTYTDEFIEANNPDEAYGRNRRKAAILRVLKDVDKIDNIKYDIYFVSCNMDHMLFGQINIASQTKSSLADAYVRECKNNPECIFTGVLNPDIAYTSSYEETWQQIQYKTNSLKRHTNMNLYLKEFMDIGGSQV